MAMVMMMPLGGGGAIVQWLACRCRHGTHGKRESNDTHCCDPYVPPAVCMVHACMHVLALPALREAWPPASNTSDCTRRPVLTCRCWDEQEWHVNVAARVGTAWCMALYALWCTTLAQQQPHMLPRQA